MTAERRDEACRQRRPAAQSSAAPPRCTVLHALTSAAASSSKPAMLLLLLFSSSTCLCSAQPWLQLQTAVGGEGRGTMSAGTCTPGLLGDQRWLPRHALTHPRGCQTPRRRSRAWRTRASLHCARCACACSCRGGGERMSGRASAGEMDPQQAQASGCLCPLAGSAGSRRPGPRCKRRRGRGSRRWCTPRRRPARAGGSGGRTGSGSRIGWGCTRAGRWSRPVEERAGRGRVESTTG